MSVSELTHAEFRTSLSHPFRCDASVLPLLLPSGAKKVINSELWHACAGPLVCLPQRGSLVYYFPQGHSEQVRMDSEYSVPVDVIFIQCLQMFLLWNTFD